MAADHALRRELSRRIRDELIGLGIVRDGPAVRIADGAQASPGDLIICTRNDRTVEAGEPGRALANGDLLRIEAVTRKGLIVRRALDADPRTGRRRWTDRTFVYANFADAELGYAVTDHVAQGRTVHTGLAVITGTEDRQHAYVALSRGTDANLAYVFTVSPKLADPAPGPRPAPELARYDRRAAGPGGQPAAASTGEALAVLAGVLDRDGQQRSATQIRNQALADADHLALLHAIWAAETTPARQQRYQRPADGRPAARLPPGSPATRRNGCGGRCAPPNWPDWTPARSWRTRSANGTWPDPATWPPSSTPASATGSAPWSRARPARGPRRSPQIADPDRRAYVAQIAALMDARKDRIGEHAADHAPPWAVAALGPVPAHPLDRLDWQKRAACHRRLAGTIRLPPPRRPDRPRTGRGRPRPAGRLARGLRRPRPGRRPGRPRHARRAAVAPARHLPHRNRLGTPMGRR